MGAIRSGPMPILTVKSGARAGPPPQAQPRGSSSGCAMRRRRCRGRPIRAPWRRPVPSELASSQRGAAHRDPDPADRAPSARSSRSHATRGDDILAIRGDPSVMALHRRSRHAPGNRSPAPRMPRPGQHGHPRRESTAIGPESRAAAEHGAAPWSGQGANHPARTWPVPAGHRNRRPGLRSSSGGGGPTTASRGAGAVMPRIATAQAVRTEIAERDDGDREDGRGARIIARRSLRRMQWRSVHGPAHFHELVRDAQRPVVSMIDHRYEICLHAADFVVPRDTGTDICPSAVKPHVILLLRSCEIYARFKRLRVASG